MWEWERGEEAKRDIRPQRHPEGEFINSDIDTRISHTYRSRYRDLYYYCFFEYLKLNSEKRPLEVIKGHKNYRRDDFSLFQKVKLSTVIMNSWTSTVLFLSDLKLSILSSLEEKRIWILAKISKFSRFRLQNQIWKGFGLTVTILEALICITSENDFLVWWIH